MKEYILVMESDEDETQWIAVALADSPDTIKALGCYDRNALIVLARSDYPGIAIGKLRIANCATPDIKETGTIYEIDSR